MALTDVALTLGAIGEAIAEAMSQIRADVELGVAGNIEPDAVLLGVAYAVIQRAGLEGADREAFSRRATS